MTQKLACVVDHIADHGERVYTVGLRPTRRAPRFRAGQFLHLTLDPYDPGGFWPESRVFSIASSPSQPDRLSLSYSVRGRYTARMERELSVGREVWVKMPYGDFVIAKDRPVVLFAGGTGVSAFTAFLEDLTPADAQPVTLVYGARRTSLLVYRQAVERCLTRAGSLAAHYFVEDASVAEAGLPAVHLAVHPGRIAVAAVWAQLPHPSATAFYISGPPAMLQTVSDDLRAHGVAGEAIHIDAWE